MPKEYQVTSTARFVNRIIDRLIRWNIAPPQTFHLTVRGRKTGRS
jgi:hypothetical protein